MSGALTPAAGADAPTADHTVTQANESEFPPGLNESAVTDPLALAEAHRETLGNSSYTLTNTITFRRANGSLLTRSTSVTRVAAGGTSFYSASLGSETNASETLGVDNYRIEVWGNETDAVVADAFRSDDPSYRTVAREDAPMGPETNWELLYSAFGATDSVVVDRFERDGTTLYRVVSAGGPDEQSAYPAHAGFDWVAVVDSQGVVREFQQTYRTTFEDQPAVVTRTMRVSNLGNTTVERPDWYDEAVGNESDGE